MKNEESSPELDAIIELVRQKRPKWTEQAIREYAAAELNFRKKDKNEIPESRDPLMR